MITLKEFIEQFVEPNTLIRLWYKVKGGHKEVVPNDKPEMEHQLAKGKYAERKVIGVTDILYLKSPYIEAVNIVIKK